MGPVGPVGPWGPLGVQKALMHMGCHFHSIFMGEHKFDTINSVFNHFRVQGGPRGPGGPKKVPLGPLRSLMAQEGPTK